VATVELRDVNKVFAEGATAVDHLNLEVRDRTGGAGPGALLRRARYADRRRLAVSERDLGRIVPS
jgi:hypothetical protein